MSAFLYRLGSFAARRAWVVIAAWVGLLAVLGGLVVGVGGQLQDSFEIPGTEGQEGLNVLHSRFPELAGAGGQVLFEAPEGEDIHRFEADINAIVDQVRKVDDVMVVTAPFGDENTRAAVSDDKRYALGNIQLATQLDDLSPAVLDELKSFARDDANGLSVYVGGQMLGQTSVGVTVTEVIGVILALFVLAITFRSLLSAAVPITTALVGVAIAMAIMLLLARFMPISSTAPTLALMLGIAVGIDYALFIVSRHRQQLADGMEVRESAARANATSGGAVVFAGGTVIIALLGLYVTNIPFLAVMGAMAAIAVAIAVGVAVSLIPAVVSLLGERIRPKAGTRAHEVSRSADKRTKATMSDWWVGVVTSHPVVVIIACIVAVAALAIPARDLALALPGNDTAEEGSQARVTYELVEKNFGPGVNDPLLMTMGIIQSQDPLTLMDNIADKVREIPGISDVEMATPNRSADIGVIVLIPETKQSDPQTADLVHRLRDHAPQWEDEFGVTDIRVTGQTAVGIDISERLSNAMVPFGVVVVGLSLILLTLVFRSLWVPLKATLGYLLSVFAAFGVVALVFEHGWFNDALGIGVVGPVISFMPVILMGVLFGLAMDYEVFLVTRMREDFVHHGDARHAVKTGFSASARVVTAAALIMISVFAFFVPEGSFYVQPIALGLAVGVAVDAFLVRMTLVPAIMTLLGERAWHLPNWLKARLPYLDVEGESIEKRLAHATWEEEHGPHIIRAERVGLADREGDLLRDISLTVPARSRTEIVVADPLQRRALAATLAGRTLPDRGELIVCGHILPAEASAVRSRASLAIGVANTASAEARAGELLVIDMGPGDSEERLASLDFPPELTVVALCDRPRDLTGFTTRTLSSETKEMAL
ncbi:putative drug exporter of the RND superfamily [Bowdeniella nasicola]|uniref:Putative drug exporter of the RND superfamily n=2 Tax=Bowdeniella nasicola TaxID=208480 RepID=A0A1H4ALV7_9ACTO|nr:putative drug exporter of the RND superfamily [Bowdeniella nasicola]